jgi:molybdate transport system substrate-binding protein
MGKRLSYIRKLTRVSSAVFMLIFSWSAIGISADLLLFAGAGLRQPADQMIQTFQKETGHTVRVTYAGSGQLMSSILASGQGDLFMPGAFFYIQKLEKMGRIDSSKKSWWRTSGCTPR